MIVEYDPAWPSEFVRLRDRAQAALGDVAVAIEHVGSTAVPGLPAKDVIDMVVVVASDGEVNEAISRLETIGYKGRGNLGVEGREAFSWPDGEKRHHLYVSPTTSAEPRSSTLRCGPRRRVHRLEASTGRASPRRPARIPRPRRSSSKRR